MAASAAMRSKLVINGPGKVITPQRPQYERKPPNWYLVDHIWPTVGRAQIPVICVSYILHILRPGFPSGRGLRWQSAARQ